MRFSNAERAETLLKELLIQKLDCPSIDVDQTDDLQAKFNLISIQDHFEILKELDRILRQHKDRRFPLLALPFSSSTKIRIEDWKESFRQTRFEVPSYYLRRDEYFFDATNEEKISALRSPLGLKAILREWRGEAEKAAGEEPYKCVFVWPERVKGNANDRGHSC